MIYHSVHMRDQKANQVAMHTKFNRQTCINLLEEVAVIVVLWGVFFVATMAA